MQATGNVCIELRARPRACTRPTPRRRDSKRRRVLRCARSGPQAASPPGRTDPLPPLRVARRCRQRQAGRHGTARRATLTAFRRSRARLLQAPAATTHHRARAPQTMRRARCPPPGAPAVAAHRRRPPRATAPTPRQSRRTKRRRRRPATAAPRGTAFRARPRRARAPHCRPGVSRRRASLLSAPPRLHPKTSTGFLRATGSRACARSARRAGAR